MVRAALIVAGIVVVAGPVLGASLLGAEQTAGDGQFDHGYAAYGHVLQAYVDDGRVDYAGLQRGRAALDRVVDEFGAVAADQFAGWSDAEQMAYWLNAYNAFTLQAIVDRYPVTRAWFNPAGWFYPADSIQQITGVWSRLTWRAAGAEWTLDEIEHEHLRVPYDAPLIHFALCCAAAGCPPIRAEPYRPGQVDRQLIVATRDYLASPAGLRIRVDDAGSADGYGAVTLQVSSVLDWYAGDFSDRYGRIVDAADATPTTRAILGVVAMYGPAEAAAIARSGSARVAFLDYDWALNDSATR